MNIFGHSQLTISLIFEFDITFSITSQGINIWSKSVQIYALDKSGFLSYSSVSAYWEVNVWRPYLEVQIRNIANNL